MGQISTTRLILTASLSYCVSRLKYIKWDKIIPVFPNFLKEENEEKLNKHTFKYAKYEECFIKVNKSCCKALCEKDYFLHLDYFLVRISPYSDWRFTDYRGLKTKSAWIRETTKQKRTRNTDIHAVKLKVSIISERLLLTLFYHVKSVFRYCK